jgi:hypothetical protein
VNGICAFCYLKYPQSQRCGARFMLAAEINCSPPSFLAIKNCRANGRHHLRSLRGRSVARVIFPGCLISKPVFLSRFLAPPLRAQNVSHFPTLGRRQENLSRSSPGLPDLVPQTFLGDLQEEIVLPAFRLASCCSSPSFDFEHRVRRPNHLAKSEEPVPNTALADSWER